MLKNLQGKKRSAAKTRREESWLLKTLSVTIIMIKILKLKQRKLRKARQLHWRSYRKNV